MILRPYQTELIGHLRDRSLAVLPTGGGKSVCIAAWAERWGWLGMLIVAHTREIIDQISNKLTIEHDLIIPGQRSLNHSVAVASVDSLIRRDIDFSKYHFIQIDEAHHVTDDNKWGRVWGLMDHAYSIGWTATPTRLDGKSLSAIFTGGLVEGPSMHDLVMAGWVTPIQVYGPPAAVDRRALRRTAGGEFDGASLRKAFEGDRAQIVGDVARSYLRFAPGLRGLTFAASLELAHAHAEAYQAHGVPAMAVHAGTVGRERYVEALRRGELLQLVVVGLFGEGADVPEIGVVSLVRPSESPGLVWQQIGRVRRPAAGKRVGVVIDHVGNVAAHGLPDFIEAWSLDEATRRTQGGAARLRTCQFCLSVFEFTGAAGCPYCGSVAPVTEARPLDTAGGELEAYTHEQLAEMAAAAARAMRAPGGRPRNPKEAVIFRRMRERVENQRTLREAMVNWGERCGETEAERLTALFQREFKIHPLAAMGLGGTEARKLMEKLKCSLTAG